MKYRLTIHLIVGEPVVIDFAERKYSEECWHNLLHGARWNSWTALGLAIQTCHIVKIVTAVIP